MTPGVPPPDGPDAQRALAEREQRLRALIETEPECVKVVSAEGRLVEMNPAGLAMLEASSVQEVQARSLLDFIAPAHRAAFVALHQRVIAGGRGTLEFEVTGLKGGRRRLETHAAPLRGPSGEVTALLGITRDVTERHRALEALRESEERFRSLTELSSDFYWEQDENFRFVERTSGPGDLRRWPRESVIGKTRWELPGLNMSEADWQAHRAVLEARREFRNLEILRPGPDGSPAWVSTSGRPIFDAEGRFRGYRGIGRDVTERKLAEQALRASNERLRMVIASSPLAIYTCDRGGLVTGWNAAAEVMFGWKADELIGHPLPTVPPDQQAESYALSARLLDGETVIEKEGERLRRDGSTIQVESFLAPLRDASGVTEGIIAMVADVTERKRAEAALRASETARRAIIDSSLDAIITVDADGRVLEFNPAAEATFHYAREAATGRRLAELVVPPGLREAHLRGFAEHREGGGGHLVGRRLEMQAMRADGSEFPVELSLAAIPSGERPIYAGFVRDITERKAAEERIRALNRVYAVLSGINALIVRVRSRDELFREACRVAVEKGGFRMAWIGRVDSGKQRIVPEAWHGTGPDYIELMPLGIEPGPPAVYGLAGIAASERRPVISDDLSRDTRVLLKREVLERRICSMAMLPLLRGDETLGVLALYASEVGFFTAEEMRLLEELASDIAFAVEHLRKDQAMHALAYYDPLTGLANRALLIERLAQRLSAAHDEGHQAALAIVNVDRFKAINDAYGRGHGDALLRAVGARLAEFAGEGNVARVGADQFAVVVPRVRRTESLVRRLGEGSRRIDGEPYPVAGRELRISSRAGIALFPGDAADAETLFQRAEAALKRAQRGEPFLFYAGEMTERLAERVALETELRGALERGEFALYYQPKFSVASRRITGLEALIRWRSPTRGLVAPGEFIGLLEETGLILEVGAWALAEAARQHRAWTEGGLRPPRVAVNVSAIQLRRADFAERLGEAVLEGLAPAGIDLEITESAVMHDVEATIAKLSEARALGMRIAIDDFGTGYSSLAYLARLPVDTLKIDRSFVVRMGEDAATMTLVRTIVSLAHSLHLGVIAEGVEARAQADALRRMGCDELQGYLLARPLPAQEAGELLRRTLRRRGRRG